MFNYKDFNFKPIKTFPPFNKIIQAWYSPLLTDSENSDENTSSAVTFGISDNPYSKFKKDVIFVSCLKENVFNTSDLKKIINCYGDDFFNKSKTPSHIERGSDAIVIDSMNGVAPKSLNGIKNNRIFYLNTEYMGKNNLEIKINFVSDFIKKIQFKESGKDDDVLCPDDSMMVLSLREGINPSNYSLLSAFVLGLLFLKREAVFEDEEVFREDKEKFRYY